jgi:hypothetical protein
VKEADYILAQILIKSDFYYPRRTHVVGKSKYTLSRFGDTIPIRISTSPVCMKSNDVAGSLLGYCIVASGRVLRSPVLVAPATKNIVWRIWDGGHGYNHGSGFILRVADIIRVSDSETRRRVHLPHVNHEDEEKVE